jgi:hypothetical protein
VESEGGGDADERIAIIGESESELIGGTWPFVEGSARAISVLCRKVLSALSDDRCVSVPCPWKSEASSSEGVAMGELL